MKTRSVRLVVTVLLFGMLGVGVMSLAAEDKLPVDEGMNLKEMPVMRGDVWQKMTHDEKVSFVWGMGHILSIERNIIAKYPDVKKAGFSGYMADGLAGISINDIVGQVDRYYAENPDDLEAPVIEVIWDDIARPNIKVAK